MCFKSRKLEFKVFIDRKDVIRDKELRCGYDVCRLIWRRVASVCLAGKESFLVFRVC